MLWGSTSDLSRSNWLLSARMASCLAFGPGRSWACPRKGWRASLPRFQGRQVGNLSDGCRTVAVRIGVTGDGRELVSGGPGTAGNRGGGPHPGRPDPLP